MGKTSISARVSVNVDEFVASVLAKRVFLHALLMFFGVVATFCILIAFLPSDCMIYGGISGLPKFIEVCSNGYQLRLFRWGFSGFRVLAWFLVTLGCFAANLIYFFFKLVKSKKQEDIENEKSLDQGMSYNWILGLLLLVFALLGAEPAISLQLFFAFDDDETHCFIRSFNRGAVCRTVKLFHVCTGFFFCILMSGLHFLLYKSYRKLSNKIRPPPPPPPADDEESKPEPPDSVVNQTK